MDALRKEEKTVSRGTYFRRCPICGCALDPGERCDCEETREEATKATTSKEPTRERLAVAVAS